MGLVQYVTKNVTSYTDTDWINGAETYDDVLGRTTGETNSQSGRERTQRSAPSQSDRSGENGQVDQGTVPIGQCQKEETVKRQ